MNYVALPEKGKHDLHVSNSQNEALAFAEQQAFSSRINFINEIAIDANHSLDEAEILRNAGRKARWLLDFDHASAYLIPSGMESTDGSVTTLFESYPSVEFYAIYAQNALNSAIQNGQPLLLPALSPNPASRDWVPARSPYGFQLIIPLQSEGQVLGTLNFALAQHAYTHDDMRIGHLLALLLSGAIRSARRFTQVSELYNDLEEAYERLKQTETRRDSLTSMIVHDLRNPLVTILGTLELVESMSDELDMEDIVAETVRRAHRAGRRMAGQISDLIDVNRFDDGVLSPRCEPLDLGTLLRLRTPEYKAQADDEEKKFLLMIPSSLPMISGDAELIGRVFDNLVNNAYKYTNTRGTISVCIAAGEQQLTISVSDDGIGIPLGYREQIFDKYGQVFDDEGRPLRQGSGLGLAFCRMAIEAHGGRIWVDVNRPRGSIFAFTLPYT